MVCDRHPTGSNGQSTVNWQDAEIEEYGAVQVAITSRHGDLHQDDHEYIAQKSEKLLTYFERVTAIGVTVDFESKDRVKVEILVDAEHKHNFVASDAGASARATLDVALHKMEQQVRKYKEKLQDHRRTPPMNEVVQSEEPDVDEESAD